MKAFTMKGPEADFGPPETHRRNTSDGEKSLALKEDEVAILAKVNEGLSAKIERPLLQWIAFNLPSWMTPNHLTLIGVGGAFLAAVAYVLTNISPAFLWLASVGLMVNWFGDSMDGTLARFRKQERPREGCFIDHTADLFSQVAIGLGCGLSPYLRLDVACLLLIGYLVLVAFTFIRATAFNILKLTYFGVGPTEIRLMLILANTYFYFVGNSQFNAGPLGPVEVADALALFAFFLEIGFFLFSAYNDLNTLCGGWSSSPPEGRTSAQPEEEQAASRKVSSPVK